MSTSQVSPCESRPAHDNLQEYIHELESRQPRSVQDNRPKQTRQLAIRPSHGDCQDRYQQGQPLAACPQCVSFHLIASDLQLQLSMTQGNLMYEVHNRRAVEEALVANSTLYKKIETAYKVCRSYNVEMRKENARLQSIVAIQTEPPPPPTSSFELDRRAPFVQHLRLLRKRLTLATEKRNSV